MSYIEMTEEVSDSKVEGVIQKELEENPKQN